MILCTNPVKDTDPMEPHTTRVATISRGTTCLLEDKIAPVDAAVVMPEASGCATKEFLA